VVLVFALAVQRRLGRAPEYSLTVIWALVAVCVRNGGVNMTVTGAAVIGIAALAANAWHATRR
jgi:hypothetical protein